MIDFSDEDIARLTKAKLFVSTGRAQFSECVIDSRKVSRASIFVAFAGEHTDGNAYAQGAIEAGAAMVVLTKEPDAALIECARQHGCALIRADADDGEEFLLRLAHAKRMQHPEYKIIAVTGSCGKTTTKDMLLAVMSSRYKSYATIANHNNLIGLPLTLLAAPGDVELIVCEMGMNHFHELSRMSRCARPNLCIITNIGTSHIGILGSRENIARAKAEILEGIEAPDDKSFEPCVLLSQVDEFSDFIARKFAAPASILVRPVALEHDMSSSAAASSASSADSDASASAPASLSASFSPSVKISDPALHVEQISFDSAACPSLDYVYADGMRIHASLPQPGISSVLDSLFALECAEILKLPRAEAIASLCAMPAVHMRLEEIRRPHTPLVIDDSYNASPHSIAQALAVLKAIGCSGRRIAVIGEVGELGARAHELHGLIGSYLAAQQLDLLVLIGTSYAQDMYDAALIMGASTQHILRYKDVEEAAEKLPTLLKEDDCVLVKASRAARLDVLVQAIIANGDTQPC